MPSATPTSPSPGPGYHWDAQTGQWVPPSTAQDSEGAAPPPPPPSGGTKVVVGYNTDGEPIYGDPPSSGSGAPAPDYGWGKPTSTSTPKPPGATTAIGDPGAGGGGGTPAEYDQNQFSSQVIAASNLANTLTSQATPQDHWETRPDGTRVWVSGDNSRAAPQASAGPGVVSDVIDVTKPTATMAGPAQQITAPTVAAPDRVSASPVNATTIAPIERVTAAQVGPASLATAGKVDAARVDADPQAEFRAQQKRLTDALEAAASGNAPSAAQIQAQKSAEEAAAQQLGLVAMNHGRGANAALRVAGRNIGTIQSKAALDNALIRATEAATARGQEAQVLGQGREQDIGLATTNANLQQGASTTNAQLGTQVAISNADREQARLMKDAELKLAADQGNQAAQNELNERQAALEAARKSQESTESLEAAKLNQGAGLTTALANATNAIDVGKANQNADLATSLKNADLGTQTSIVGATEANKVGLTNAAQDLQAQLANQDNATKVALANAGFTLQGRSIDDARNIAAVNQALQAQAQAATTADMRFKNQMALDQFNQAVADKDWDRALKITTAVVGAVAQVGASAAPALAASDRRGKKNIKRESDKNIDKFIGALEASSYRYKNPNAPGAAEGRMSGPMAQELEKSLIGRSAVRTGADGKKMVDTGRLTLALAGAVARLAKQKRRAA